MSNWARRRSGSATPEISKPRRRTAPMMASWTEALVPSPTPRCWSRRSGPTKPPARKGFSASRSLAGSPATAGANCSPRPRLRIGPARGSSCAPASGMTPSCERHEHLGRSSSLPPASRRAYRVPWPDRRGSHEPDRGSAGVQGRFADTAPNLDAPWVSTRPTFAGRIRSARSPSGCAIGMARRRPPASPSTAAVDAFFDRVDALSAPGSVLLYDVVGTTLLRALLMAPLLESIAPRPVRRRLFSTDDPGHLAQRLGWSAVVTDVAEPGNSTTAGTRLRCRSTSPTCRAAISSKRRSRAPSPCPAVHFVQP